MESNREKWPSHMDTSVGDEDDDDFGTEVDEEHEESDAESVTSAAPFGYTFFGSSETNSPMLSNYERPIHEATYEGDSRDAHAY